MTTTESKTIPTLPQPLVFNRSMTTSALSKMVLQLQRNHLVVLSGPSGNGKSTFATETLRRYLQNGETEGKNGKEWRTIVTAPFADPIGNLATALARRDALFSEEDVMDRAEIADLLRRDRNALSTLFKRATKNNGRFNFLLIVDQKEELFRYRNILQELGRGDDDIIYVNLLLDAIKAQEEEVAIYIVFVADTRNFHYFAHYRGLPEAMNNFRMELPDLSAAEIGRVLTSYKDQATLIRYREAAQKLAPGDREIAENNLAFFEWLAQQHAFVDRLLFDFKDLSNDEFALQKFNIFLRWVIQECTQSIANIQTEQLLAVYKQLGPMRNVVQNFIEKKVWSQLTPVQKRQTELLFKALTVSTTDKRRPLQWEALAKLVDRDYETHPLLPWTGPKTPFLSKDAQAILSKFNTINEIFFLPRDWDIWPDQVVDINADILIDEWDKVQEWIEQEQKHADIYRDLADAAIAFFSKKEQPAANAPANHTGGIIQRESLWDVVKEWWNNIYPTDQPSFQSAELHESPYYEGTTLVEALEWIKTQQPNANWAARYDPPASDLQHAQRRAALPPALQDASDWELAQRFLHLSAEQEKLKRDQEEQARQKIMRLQRMSVIGAGVASIACIVALVFWDGRNERINR